MQNEYRGTAWAKSKYADWAPRLAALYELAQRSQWDLDGDIDWSTGFDAEAPLPADSPLAVSEFSKSQLARFGPSFWDTFRRERQTWLVSQFLHGEQAALLAAARLSESLESTDGKCCAASQAIDEARHFLAFSRYVRERIPDPYGASESLSSFFRTALADRAWDFTALGLHVVLEPVALAIFRLAGSTFHDPLLHQLSLLIARDEARHVSFGVAILNEKCRTLSAREMAERESFVLQAIDLLNGQFLMKELWMRLGVEREDGLSVATTNPIMVYYRQAVFTKVVSNLRRIGLLTPRVGASLRNLDILHARNSARVISDSTYGRCE